MKKVHSEDFIVSVGIFEIVWAILLTKYSIWIVWAYLKYAANHCNYIHVALPLQTTGGSYVTHICEPLTNHCDLILQ